MAPGLLPQVVRGVDALHLPRISQCSCRKKYNVVAVSGLQDQASINLQHPCAWPQSGKSAAQNHVLAGTQGLSKRDAPGEPIGAVSLARDIRSWPGRCERQSSFLCVSSPRFPLSSQAVKLAAPNHPAILVESKRAEVANGSDRQVTNKVFYGLLDMPQTPGQMRPVSQFPARHLA